MTAPLPTFALLAALATGLLAAPADALAQSWTSVDASAGTGVRTWPDGRRYEGGHVDGRMHGRGVLSWPNGARYEGDFFRDAMHGRGTLVHATGDRYEGDFAENRPWGRGVLVFADGSRYEGEFVAGVIAGRGTHAWTPAGQTEPQRYEGQFVAGKRNGFGAHHAFSTVVHEGGYLDGERNGPGLTRVPGRGGVTQNQGDFVRGRLKGWGKALLSGTTMEEVQFLETGGLMPARKLPKSPTYGQRAPEAAELEAAVKARSAEAARLSEQARAMSAADADRRLALARASAPAAVAAAGAGGAGATVPGAGSETGASAAGRAGTSTATGGAASGASGATGPSGTGVPTGPSGASAAAGAASGTAAATAAPTTAVAASGAATPTSGTATAAPGRPTHTLLVSVAGVDTPRRVTTTLLPTDGVPVPACDRRFMFAGEMEDGVRELRCTPGVPLGTGRYVDGTRRGELVWGYAMPDGATAPPVKTYREWRDSRYPNSELKAVQIYYRFTTGPLAGQSYTTIVGPVPGANAVFFSDGYYSKN